MTARVFGSGRSTLTCSRLTLTNTAGALRPARRSSRPPRSSPNRSKARRRYANRTSFGFSRARLERALLHSAARPVPCRVSLFTQPNERSRGGARCSILAPSRTAGRVMESGSPPASPKTPDDIRHADDWSFFVFFFFFRRDDDAATTRSVLLGRFRFFFSIITRELTVPRAKSFFASC